MRRHPTAGPADAARHFWPQLDPTEQRKKAKKVRTWKSRARDADRPASRPSSSARSSTAPTGEPAAADDLPSMPAPDMSVAQLERLDALEWLVAHLAAGVEHAHALGDVKALSTVSRTFIEARRDLDKERERRARVTGLGEGADRVAHALDAVSEVLERHRRHRQATQQAAKAKGKSL